MMRSTKNNLASLEALLHAYAIAQGVLQCTGIDVDLAIETFLSMDILEATILHIKRLTKDVACL